MRLKLTCVYIIIICLFVSSCTMVDQDTSSATGKGNDVIVETVSDSMHEIEMDKTMKRKVNVFLSNFAECFIDDFNIEERNDKELVNFAVSHNYKNNYKLWLPGDSSSTIKIDAKFIDRTIEKYFNVKEINHTSVGNEITYREGFYFIQQADGEVIPFVQVTKLVQGEDGLLTAFGDVYGNANYLIKEDPYEPLETWTDEEKKDIEFYQHIKAEFNEIEENGLKRYVLVKYSTIN